MNGGRSGSAPDLPAAWSAAARPSVWSRARPSYAVTIVLLETLLAAVLAFLLLGEKSLWLDEAVSVRLVGLEWQDLWQRFSTVDPNMALYFVALRPWSELGESEFAFRSLSAVFAVLAVPLVAAVAYQALGRDVGLLAGGLLSLNAFFIQYAQEARSYSLFLLLTTASTLLFLRAVRSGSGMAWAAYAAISALAAYAHVFAVLVPAAHACSLPFLGRRALDFRTPALAFAAIAAMLLPIWLFLAAGGELGHLDWMPSLTLRRLAVPFVVMSGGLVPVAGYFVACGIAVLVAAGRWQAARSPTPVWPHVLVLSWLLVPFLVLVAVSVVKPVLEPRFLIGSLPALVILTSAGIRALPARYAVVLAGIVVLASVGGLGQWYLLYEKEDWRAAASYVLSASRPGDAVIYFAPYARGPFSYYERRADMEGLLSEVSHESMLRASPAAEGGGTRVGAVPARIWLVLSHDKARNLKATSHEIEEALENDHVASARREFAGVRVVLYERPERGR